MRGTVGDKDDWNIGTDGTATVPITTPPEVAKPKRSGIVAALAVAGAAVLKVLKPLLIGLKFFKLGAAFKTGLTMILSMWAYAMTWGWSFAALFVLLLFIHEMGHAIALKKFGVNAGAPVFIPFVGAFIAMKEMPKDVRVEAWTAMAGPLAGTAGAIACCAVAIALHSKLLVAAAYSGFFLNLFNLIPISPLDGGRVVAAISPRLWIFGFIGILLFFLQSWNPILLIILIPAGRNVYNLWKKKDAAQSQYYEVDRKTKIKIGILYFALLAFLPLAMAVTHVR
ncbi:site-2 protease family protein [Geomesophilobacter sediminis]|uniref:Site-2 protease family protein n=1 Tax=Geomesophilobacter sediminis TaxID=2798584 RepID=A0A8J7M049_9BACT|nr:site-2 protease family protein [Geomesophilobacter sediminis]MBJ6723327.1 site-2 protease family protein [Geomesophilobacter sediminis]